MRRLIITLQTYYYYFRMSTKTFSSNDVLNAILEPHDWRGTTLKMLDKTYKVPSHKNLVQTIGSMWATQRKYSLDQYDCENFSVWFWAWLGGLGSNACGLVLDTSGAHAYNIVVTHTDGVLKAHLLEPQTGQFVHKGQNLGAALYTKENCIVLVG